MTGNHKISVIIPCYNQGAYIEETITSVLNQTFQDFEIIIVNDGSTDPDTNTYLKNLKKPKTKVIFTKNQGVASARNTGIKEASGDYILPLDADDKIGKEYLEKAVQILDKDLNITLVYCEAEYFDGKKGSWRLPEFSFDRLLMNNIIFCSGIFRKKDWEKIGGYSENMVHGYEDWEFWISLLENGGNVYKIPEILFYYRIKKESRTISLMTNKENELKMIVQNIINHKELYFKNAHLMYLALENFIYLNRLPYYNFSLSIDPGEGFLLEKSIQKIVNLTKDDCFKVSYKIENNHNIKTFCLQLLEGYFAKVENLNVYAININGERKIIPNKRISSNGEYIKGCFLFKTFKPKIFIPYIDKMNRLEISGKLKVLSKSQTQYKLEKNMHILNFLKSPIIYGFKLFKMVLRKIKNR